MKNAGKRTSSRKGAKESRGRKGQEESERQLTGAGWTAAATQHFIDLPSDEERLGHVRAMFNISEEDYKYQTRHTFVADFHLANGLYCITHDYDAAQTQFICRSLSELLDITIAAAQQAEPISFDKFRGHLLERYQALFFEFNQEEYRFTLEQAETILKFIADVLLGPLRLIVITVKYAQEEIAVYEPRKISRPVIPPPLVEFSEFIPLPLTEDEFTPPEFPKVVRLADVRKAMAQYTSHSLEVIERRYNRMEELAQRLAQLQL
jgi:hypothetical protein